MAEERVFLDWDQPCLPAAARWLLDHFDGQSQALLDEVTIVVPGRRAGRRLLELLVAEAGGKLLHPPHITTPGQLPELLCDATTRVADDLEATLARVAAMRAMPRESLTPVIPYLPDAGDVLGWVELARELATLSAELASGMLTPGDVPARSESLDAFADEARWRVLQEIETNYQQTLTLLNLTDVTASHLAAARDGTRGHDAPIVLVGVLDLPLLTQRLLEVQQGDVIALVHAPSAEADSFTAMGTLQIEQWEHRPLELDPAQVHVVDRPRDQIDQTLRILSDWANEGEASPSVNDITVGLGDQAQADTYARTFDLLGLRARPAVGQTLDRTGPLRLLDALATYLRGGRAHDFAAMLRRPDLEAWLMQMLGERDGVQPGAAVWLQAIDDYLTEHLPATLDGAWLGDQSKSVLPRVYEAVQSLLPDDARQPRPLAMWAPAIAQLLTSVYSTRELSSENDADAALIATLEHIGAKLREQAAIESHRDTAAAIEPDVTMAEAIRLLQSQLAGTELPNTTPSPAIEMLGWLELHLDDAPALIITGVNEGAIPASINADAFLPDRLRAHLGLTDNRRRYVRDLASLTAIMHSRPRVQLVTGRVDAEGNPLTPSRLLLATAGRQLAERVLTFYDRPDDESLGRPAVQLLKAGARVAFSSPRRIRQPHRLSACASPRFAITWHVRIAFTWRTCWG